MIIAKLQQIVSNIYIHHSPSLKINEANAAADSFELEEKLKIRKE